MASESSHSLQDSRSPRIPGHDDARAELLRLVDSGLGSGRGAETALQLVDRHPWKLTNMPAAPAREAAVLILFGQLGQADLPGVQNGASEPHRVPVDQLDVVLLVRASTLRSHAGEPAFPGGKLDPEDYEAGNPHIEAALREAAEETGLDRSGVEVLGTAAPIPLPVTNFMVTPVLAWWSRPSWVGVMDETESAHVFRVPVRDLLNPDHRHLATVTRGKVTHKTPAFTVPTEKGEVTIWGFTGILLDRLLHRLGWEQPWDQTRKAPAPGQ